MGALSELNKHKSIDLPLGYNVLTLLDHSTGIWVKGTRGEMIMVGGLTHHTAVLAMANAGKTALALYMWATAVRRYPSSTGHIYECEGTLFAPRVNKQGNACGDGIPFDITDQDDEEPRLMMIDGTSLFLDPYYDILEEESYARHKQRGVKKYSVTLPFQLNKSRGCSMNKPLFILIDSASESSVTSAAKLDDKKGGSVDAKERNTEYLREGLVKTKVFGGRMIGLGTRADMCVISTASLDKAGPSMSSMPGAPEEREMGQLGQGKKMKQLGTSYKKRTSNMHQFGQPRAGFKGTSAADKVPKYPLSADEVFVGNKDLEYVSVQNLRGKASTSGLLLNIWRSQSYGVLPDVTNIEFLRGWGGTSIRDYGVDGAGQYQYVFTFAPDISFRNTTFRAVCNASRSVRRAAELLVSMKFEFYAAQTPELMKYRCTPQELYDDIKALGYDWSELLEGTRGYWQFLEDETLPYLSIYDLLRMRAGEYKPYWM